MASEKELVTAHYSAVAKDYQRQYDRDELLTGDVYPANFVRLQILVNRLAQLRVNRVYEIGVGEGTPLVTMARMGLQVAGCDVSEAMVQAAQRNFELAGLATGAVRWGDVEDSTTLVDQLADGPYDAVIAAGVLPHVQSDDLMLENVRMLLRPGGRAFVEFRNKLFSLFTFNRFTKSFILDDLLSGVDDAVRGVVARELDRFLATDQPPRRERLETGEPDYDAILARFHNPFELVNIFEAHGFRDCKIHWYHYHPAPPMFEAAVGDAFRAEGLRLEHESSGWRGLFLCSAGIIEAEAT